MAVRRFGLALLPAAAIAGANVLALGPTPLACGACLAWLVGAPVVLALVLAAVLPGGRASAPSAPSPPALPAALAEEGALRLLGLLQEEGRLVDFLEEDIGGYSDEQIGAGVRGIHEACRKVLRERVGLEPVLRGGEGETVVVEPGFDSRAIRLTGNVGGEPPFRGVLRHAGWRARAATFPVRPGLDPRVIAPAEVEID